MHRRTAFCLLAGALVAPFASGIVSVARATPPGKNGKIVVNRYRYRSDVLWGELFVIDADGTNERKITHAPRGFDDNAADWAPDGSRIVFQRCAPSGGRCAIWSVKADGTRPIRLSPHCPPGGSPPRCVDDTAPAYAPDSKRVAFTRLTTCCVPALLVANDHLGRPKRILRGGRPCGNPADPVWSPDGSQIAFLERNETGVKGEPRHGRAICIVDADGGRPRRLTPWRLRAGFAPDWSPDGGRILFRTMPNGDDGPGGNLYSIGVAGRGLRQLTHFDRRVRVLQSGSYSPDGRSILLATTKNATPGLGLLPDVFVMSADGTDLRPVTRTRNWDGSPDWGPAVR